MSEIFGFLQKLRNTNLTKFVNVLHCKMFDKHKKYFRKGCHAYIYHTNLNDCRIKEQLTKQSFSFIVSKSFFFSISIKLHHTNNKYK